MQRVFRVIFFGTPELSAENLKYLLAQPDLVEIVGVISNPDTTGGRGHEMIVSPVSQLAREKNLPLFQPEKVRNNPQFLEQVRALKPDIGVVVAYGKILPQELLGIPPMGFLNVHTSLLPKYRGAAPIQYALLNGEEYTGLTVMQMSEKMDEGDILLQENWRLTPRDTTGLLFEKTGTHGWPLLCDVLEGFQEGTITPAPQDHLQATYTKYIAKTDAEIQPDWSIQYTHHAWQAYTPWPGLYTFFGDTKVTLHRVSEKTFKETEMEKWEIFSWQVIDNLPALTLQDGYLLIHEITLAGKKKMTGEEFVRGYMRNS